MAKRKLAKLLRSSLDEPMLARIAAIDAMQSGHSSARERFFDCPEEAVGAELGSQYHIPSWTLETLVNELLCTPKHQGICRQLRYDRYANFRLLSSLIAKVENAEDGIFLAKHDIFTEMHRIGQRQFPWQRGWLNGPALYRALALYGTGEAAAYFERESGITVSDFMLVGIWLASALSKKDVVHRCTNLSELNINVEQRETAIAKLTIEHGDARARAFKVRSRNLHTAYKPSILRDFPIIAFGEHGERLRAPLPNLINYRLMSGLYLDVVGGGPKVWKHIGEAFEAYCVEYLKTMLAPLSVDGEINYGPKKARRRSPDVIVSQDHSVVLVAECKAKRMPLEARFADDPVAESATGYEEIAKGIFQIWRFFSHARRGLIGTLKVRPDCVGVILTVDPWLTMARNQEKEVYEIARKFADQEGDIEKQDRRHLAVCLIDDVELALQHGTAESFLTACHELTTGEKQGWILSVAHIAEQSANRPYPFQDRIGDLLPWWRQIGEGTNPDGEYASGATLP